MNSFTMLSSNKQSSSAALHPVPYEGNWIDIRECMASISTSIFKQDDLGENLQTHMHSLACMYLLTSFSTRFLLLVISSTTFCHTGVHFSIITFLHAVPHPLKTRFFGVFSLVFIYLFHLCFSLDTWILQYAIWLQLQNLVSHQMGNKTDDLVVIP